MKTVAVSCAIAVLSIALGAHLARAQSDTPPPTSAQSTQPATPLQLQVPSDPFPTDPSPTAPGANPGNAIVDANDSAGAERDRGPQVHGSVTTGIGYAKGYGTSTMGAADLDISGQTDGGRSYDVQIHVMRGDGPGFGPWRGPRYRGD